MPPKGLGTVLIMCTIILYKSSPLVGFVDGSLWDSYLKKTICLLNERLVMKTGCKCFLLFWIEP